MRAMWSGAKGFGMKSYAPSFIAWTATSMLPWAVIITTGTSDSPFRSSSSTSSPFMPGIM